MRILISNSEKKKYIGRHFGTDGRAEFNLLIT